MAALNELAAICIQKKVIWSPICPWIVLCQLFRFGTNKSRALGVTTVVQTPEHVSDDAAVAEYPYLIVVVQAEDCPYHRGSFGAALRRHLDRHSLAGCHGPLLAVFQIHAEDLLTSDGGPTLLADLQGHDTSLYQV